MTCLIIVWIRSCVENVFEWVWSWEGSLGEYGHFAGFLSVLVCIIIMFYKRDRLGISF